MKPNVSIRKSRGTGNALRIEAGNPLNFRFPVFLDVTGKSCLVTGEGYEVPQKVQALVDAGAQVTYVNPQAEARIADLIARGAIRWQQREFEENDLNGRFLVIADTEENDRIFGLAEARGVLCNCVDDPTHCRFSFGSIHRRGELTMAISTNGWAPAVAVRLRQWLEREIGPEYEELLALLKEVRPGITQGIADFATRRELWYRIVDSPVLELLRRGENANAAALVHRLIDETINSTSHAGTCGDGADQ